MLAPDVRFEGFTHEQWTSLLALLSPVPATGPPIDHPAPPAEGWIDRGVIGVRLDGRLAKLVHTGRGRLPIGGDEPAGGTTARELARRHGARWSMRIDGGALERIMDAAGAEARRDDGLTEQALALGDAALAELSRGGVDLYWRSRRAQAWVDRLLGLARHRGAAAALRTAVPLAGWLGRQGWPSGQVLLLAAFEADRLATCVAVRRGPQGIDAIVGPEALGVSSGRRAGPLADAHRRLCELTRVRVGPLAVGCSGQQLALRRLVSAPGLRSAVQAVAVGQLQLDPLPKPLAVLLGLGVRRCGSRHGAA